MKAIGGLLIICVIQTCSVFADDNSARRYAALDRDAVTCKYFLLSKKQAQDSLKLTQQQIKSLESEWRSSSLTNDPAIAEYRRSHKQLLAAAQSDEERAKIRREGNEKYSLLVKQYEETTLQSILSSAQTKRLNELFLQMKGPHAILEDTNVARELNLSKEQISRMNDDFNSDGQTLSLLRQRFLRLQIQPMRKRDRADLDSEMKSLVQVIKEVEKDRDDGILAVLNEEQHRLWNNFCGAPVSIDWKMDFFSDTPFQEEKVNDNQ
jgi:Spy/CpxP family protein refolding chaperone